MKYLVKMERFDNKGNLFEVLFRKNKCVDGWVNSELDAYNFTCKSANNLINKLKREYAHGLERGSVKISIKSIPETQKEYMDIQADKWEGSGDYHC